MSHTMGLPELLADLTKRGDDGMTGGYVTVTVVNKTAAAQLYPTLQTLPGAKVRQLFMSWTTAVDVVIDGVPLTFVFERRDVAA